MLKIKVAKDEVKKYLWCDVDNPPQPIFEPFNQLIQTKECRTKIR